MLLNCQGLFEDTLFEKPQTEANCLQEVRFFLLPTQEVFSQQLIFGSNLIFLELLRFKIGWAKHI